MGGCQRVGDEPGDAGRVGAERKHQKAAGEREILQEIPEHLAALARARQTKIRRFQNCFHSSAVTMQ